MEEDFAEKVRKLLSDPESVAKIKQIADGFSANGTSAEKTPSAPAENAAPAEAVQAVETPTPAIPDPPVPAAQVPPKTELPSSIKLSTLNSSKEEKLALLRSVKPFLKEGRREKVDSMIRMISVASLLTGFNKEEK